MHIFKIILVVMVVALAAFIFFVSGGQFELPRGETTSLNEERESQTTSTRQVFITDGVRHSISLNEILSGGPGKDGIPAIDNPQFISTKEADKFLDETEIGLGFVHKGKARFYPYYILVYHELVNDTMEGDPILVSYCPLCLTGIVFERRVRGEIQEFGVSGKLWRSNLLMYNRTEDEDDESLWSQVLGEAVLGVNTGEKLAILPSDTVRYGDWKKAYANTKVLGPDPKRASYYGRDPYGGYYTSREVGFGATFNDTRAHPKTIILGIEFDGVFKAYSKDALLIGKTEDVFNERDIAITKNNLGEIRFLVDGEPYPHVEGFWFSWLAVHPETELYQ
jgi:hypothetical protein